MSLSLSAGTSSGRAFAPTVAERWVCGLAIAIGLIAAVAFWAARGSLWEDEIIAITHGLQPSSSFVVELLRNDIHPAVWFFVLKGWAALAPGSDRWALASSLLFAFASAACVYRVALRHGGASAAGWATALFCVQPTFAWAAGTLRMYSLIPLLAVASWHLGRRLLTARADRGTTARTRVLGASLVALQWVLAYSHAIEFLFVGLIALNVLWLDWQRADRAGLWRWARWQALMLAGLLPLPLSALSRGTEPLAASDWSGLFHFPSAMVAGWPLETDRVALMAGGAVFLAMAALAAMARDGRRILLGLPVGGLLAALVIGLFGKPLFKGPVFAANLLPFLAIAAGLGATRLRRPAVKAVAALLLLAMSAAVLPWSRRELPPENYANAARALADAARPGDVVVVPNLSVFWGVLRYAATPQWGHPLEVLPPDNASWQGLKRKLGPAWTQRLHLDQTTDRLKFNGITFIVGEARDVEVPPGGSVWLVQRARYASTIGLTTPVAAARTQWFGEELSLRELQADPAGSETVSNRPPR